MAGIARLPLELLVLSHPELIAVGRAGVEGPALAEANFSHPAYRALAAAAAMARDLRHEATSRLFERGYDIPEVAQFTLHESWTTLKRYTHLRPEQVEERPAKAPPNPADILQTGPSPPFSTEI